MDRRDAPTWIAIELTKFGEQKIEEGTLADAIRRDLNAEANHGVFVPAVTYTKGRRAITIHLMEGYVFVASGLDETAYFALERKPYVAQVLSTLTGNRRMRTLSVIPDSQIREMKRQLRQMAASDIIMGAKVKVTEGTYRALEGIVVGLDDDHAAVKIELRSLKVLAFIPRLFLDSQREGDHG